MAGSFCPPQMLVPMCIASSCPNSLRRSVAEQSSPTVLRLDQAVEVRPVSAPVHPLPAKMRAGVTLTWGVLGLMLLFILWSMFAAQGLLSVSMRGTPTTLAADTVMHRLVSIEQKEAREFWLKTVQLILGNVLLPVLTALLGYVFGTQTANSSETGKA